MHRTGRRAPAWCPVLGALLLFGPSGAGGAAAQEVSIAPAVAGLFVDEEKLVEGKVTATEREAGTVRLRLGTPPQSLTVSLIIGLLSTFPPEPERYYAGQTVRVTGRIRSFRGALEMVIRDPAHIAIAGGTATGGTATGGSATGGSATGGSATGKVAASDSAASDSAASDSAAGDASLQDTIDALRRRVRELEEQVRHLQRRGGGTK